MTMIWGILLIFCMHEALRNYAIKSYKTAIGTSFVAGCAFIIFILFIPTFHL